MITSTTVNFYLLCLLPLINILSVRSSLREQSKSSHLLDTKFNFHEYSEYPDTDGENRVRGPQAPQWEQIAQRPIQLGNNLNYITMKTPEKFPDTLSPNISYDSKWGAGLKLGQTSAVSLDPKGNVAIFHRGSRVWGISTFDNENKFNPNDGPIRENTIVLLDKEGKPILEWGRNIFYLPHGLTIDASGNYWVTDVALHQVFKFDAKDIEENFEKLRKDSHSQIHLTNVRNPQELFANSLLKPSLILGDAFKPGNDEKRFCKPTAVAVLKNGDFFVADGYCNSRIIKFNKDGERILQWGRKSVEIEGLPYQEPSPNIFSVPHALAISEEDNYVFVADRENGRISCFFANNGSFHKEYNPPMIQGTIYSIAYAKKKIYTINGARMFGLSNGHVRGYAIDVNSDEVVSQFAPDHDMDNPHDIAVSSDASDIYVVELNLHKVYKFSQGSNAAQRINGSTKNVVSTHHESEPLTIMDSIDSSKANDSTLTANVILTLIAAVTILIAVCVALAALVARCQKRARRKPGWEPNERRENFKLSHFLDGRKGKSFKFFEKRPNTRDFSKLNTEPESSEDEHPENSLTKII